MTDLLDRCQQMLAALNNSSFTKDEQLDRASRCLDGLILSDLDSQVRERLTAPLAELNSVTAPYELQDDETLTRLSDEDKARYWDLLHTAAQAGIDAQTQHLLGSLDAAESHLPVETIKEIRQHRDLMIPALIESIKRATVVAQKGESTGEAAFYSLYLLGEFEATEALPAILEAISLPGDLPDDIFDGAITEVLPRVLAIMVGQSFELLDNLFLNRQLNQFVRWAACDAYPLLARAGKLSHDEAVERLRLGLREVIENRDHELGLALVSSLEKLAPRAALPEIKAVYQANLVEVGFISYEELVEAAGRSEQEALQANDLHGAAVVTDCIAELREWPCFQEPTKPPKPLTIPAPHRPAPQSVPPLTVNATARASARPGRNDPCPCGSGKKYKKCCTNK